MNSHNALPCLEFCDDIIQMYSFANNISVIDFVKLYENSRNRDVRIELEQNKSGEFNLDKMFQI